MLQTMTITTETLNGMYTEVRERYGPGDRLKWIAVLNEIHEHFEHENNDCQRCIELAEDSDYWLEHIRDTGCMEP